MADPHQPVGNDGGDVVNVNTPIPTQAERDLLETKPTTAEQHLIDHDAEGHPEQHVPVDEAEHVVEDKPTTAEQHVAGNDAEGEPEHEEAFVPPVEHQEESAESPDQQEQGEHNLEAAAGHSDAEQVAADHPEVADGEQELHQ